MGLSVVGAGFGRTGTLSLKGALELLGFGSCYHMVEVIQNPTFIKFWIAAAKGETMNWDEVFNGYHSAVDWPVASYWRELAAYYPESKVILSVRSPESWFESATNTIFSPQTRERMSDTFGDVESDGAGGLDMGAMMKKIMVDTFGGKPLDDKENAMAVFERHNQTVIDTIPADRLLVFEASQGWEPLCAFLDVPVPDVPYMEVNKREDFGKHVEEGFQDATS